MVATPIDTKKITQVSATMKDWHDATGKGPKQLVSELSGTVCPLGCRGKLMQQGYCCA